MINGASAWLVPRNCCWNHAKTTKIQLLPDCLLQSHNCNWNGIGRCKAVVISIREICGGSQLSNLHSQALVDFIAVFILQGWFLKLPWSYVLWLTSLDTWIHPGWSARTHTELKWIPLSQGKRYKLAIMSSVVMPSPCSFRFSAHELFIQFSDFHDYQSQNENSGEIFMSWFGPIV